MLVVDPLEGCCLQTERLIEISMRMKKPIVLVLNKIDRLILEAKLPPEDCYQILKNSLDEINLKV
jgi:U5 small nuclear ribonucleoprotein component